MWRSCFHRSHRWTCSRDHTCTTLTCRSPWVMFCPALRLVSLVQERTLSLKEDWLLSHFFLHYSARLTRSVVIREPKLLDDCCNRMKFHKLHANLCLCSCSFTSLHTFISALFDSSSAQDTYVNRWNRSQSIAGIRCKWSSFLLNHLQTLPPSICRTGSAQSHRSFVHWGCLPRVERRVARRATVHTSRLQTYRTHFPLLRDSLVKQYLFSEVLLWLPRLIIYLYNWNTSYSTAGTRDTWLFYWCLDLPWWSLIHAELSLPYHTPSWTYSVIRESVGRARGNKLLQNKNAKLNLISSSVFFFLFLFQATNRGQIQCKITTKNSWAKLLMPESNSSFLCCQ